MGVAAVLIAAMGMTGCGALKEAASEGSSSGSFLTKSEAESRTKSAVMDLSTTDLRVPKSPEESREENRLASLCDQLPSDKQLAGFSRIWDGDDGLWIRNYVVAYRITEGAEILDEIAEERQSCKKNKASDGTFSTVLKPLELAPPKGVDEVFAYCEHFDKDEYYECNGFLPHGNLVSEINADGRTKKEAIALLESLLPIAGEALVKT
ncbi:MAG: hypothetical protein ACRDT8_01995 [Micromonosporaceae bacterium]